MPEEREEANRLELSDYYPSPQQNPIPGVLHTSEEDTVLDLAVCTLVYNVHKAPLYLEQWTSSKWGMHGGLVVE